MGVWGGLTNSCEKKKSGQGEMWMAPNHEHIITEVNPAEVTFLRELVKSQQETIRLLVEKRAGNSQSIQL